MIADIRINTSRAVISATPFSLCVLTAHLLGNLKSGSFLDTWHSWGRSARRRSELVREREAANAHLRAQVVAQECRRILCLVDLLGPARQKHVHCANLIGGIRQNRHWSVPGTVRVGAPRIGGAGDVVAEAQ